MDWAQWGFWSQWTVGLFLTGLIWTIQCVHYPLFMYIGSKEFSEYHAEHTRRITFLVLPSMGLELMASGIWMAMAVGWFSTFTFACVLGIWAVTAFISVPCHNRLAKVKEKSTIQRLVSSNWLRTLLWTTKSTIGGIYLFV